MSSSLFSPGSDVSASARSAYERLAKDSNALSAWVRTTLDLWWRLIPETAAEDVRRRFRLRNDMAHLSAFWELYTHQLLIGQGFAVDCDIGNDDSGERRPDFHAVKPGYDIQVEATVVRGDDVVPHDDRARLDQFYEALNRVRSTEFLVDVFVQEVGPRTIGGRQLREFDAWLHGLDHAEQRALRGTEQGPDAFELNIDGWRATITASPVPRPPVRGNGLIANKREGWARHIIGADGENPQEVEGFAAIDDVSPLSKQLRQKAGHGYLLDEKPFVVAALCDGTFIEENDIIQALLGERLYGLGSTPDRYNGGGLWLDNGRKPINTRVSAVLTAVQLSPLAIATVEPRLWLNPWARYPLAIDGCHIPAWVIAPDGTVREHQGRPPADLLGLDPLST